MAINYTVSYTFAPNTTISSSQVNTNFSDNANTWTGLEALTKTFAKLKVDVDPATALEVSTKQYVDHYSTYRRPVLQYSSSTVVNMETGINGTSGQAQILFPDGNLRTDSTTSRINGDLSRNAVLSSTAQSGLRSGSSASSTWYAVYAVKTTDNSSNFVMVFDTVFPLQANFATLNSNFGTSGWVYLGTIRNDGSGNIVSFGQSGAMSVMRNVTTMATSTGATNGVALATAITNTAVAYTYAAGSGAAQVPTNFYIVKYVYTTSATAATTAEFMNQAGTAYYRVTAKATTDYAVGGEWVSPNDGCKLIVDVNSNLAVGIAGWVDGVLGIGSNPIL